MLRFQCVPPSGQRVPIVVCHRCGQTIDDPRFAGVIYQTGQTVGDQGPVEVLCKLNRCLDVRLREIYLANRESPPWWELTWVLNYLMDRNRLAGRDEMRDAPDLRWAE